MFIEKNIIQFTKPYIYIEDSDAKRKKGKKSVFLAFMDLKTEFYKVTLKLKWDKKNCTI